MYIVEDDFVIIPAPCPPAISASPFETRSKEPSRSPRPPQARELAWLIGSLRSTLGQLKHGLEECYALLAPVDGPGSTLALTTPRHETVKGHVTRVGTRLVRGAVSLRLRTLPPQTLALSPARPIRLAPLAALHALLTRSVDLLALCLSYGDERGSPPEEAPFLVAQLRVLAQNLAESSAILKGAPPPSSASSESSLSSTHRPGSSASASASASGWTGARALELGAGGSWTMHSASLWHFSDPAPPHAHVTTTTTRRSNNLSLYLTVEDASLVLYVRALEPADAPMNFGAKLAFAIGTARRIEHDEAERVFRYACDDESRPGGGVDGAAAPSSTATPATAGIGTGAAGSGKGHGSGVGGDGNGDRGSARDDGEEETRRRRHLVDVYVREKVRVESPDPSLLSLSAKLGALSNTLALARRNLAAAMGEEFGD
ncbi:hypothetical protein DL766_007544 [Monosporascus sp. MC13-8B]|uniref:RAVE subunit 2/Rogdi n=1 Tax=Monosporascus cannonballus TaxID=155416 RepID=A0ABY0H5R4_9PEZI|nr:hypothetical protein DL762_005126 [Monosporascus cannonballus]RYO91509.1 hypothetical protein DL763_004973 [Monosporascus cannonballus]RYP23225.1 hypothetical protein DL766_007544 [Monosporascus sp. MC13-8B]